MLRSPLGPRAILNGPETVQKDTILVVATILSVLFIISTMMIRETLGVNI